MIAWRITKQGDILENQELIKNEREADNFSKRYYNKTIKTRELTNEERINHGFAPLLVDKIPIAHPNNADATHTSARLKKGTLNKILSNPWVITIGGGLILAAIAKLFKLI